MKGQLTEEPSSRIQMIAHRGGGDVDRTHENERRAIAMNLEGSDLGLHLAVQRLKEGVWIVWHGRILDRRGRLRSPWNITCADVDKEISRLHLLTLEDVIRLTREREKKLYIEPKIPARFRKGETREHIRSLAEECDGDVVAAIMTSKRNVVRLLYENNEERSVEDLPIIPVGVIFDERKLSETTAAFQTEEQRTETAIASRVGTCIGAMCPLNTYPDVVFLDREAALVGSEVLRAVHRNAGLVAVLTVNSNDDVLRLQSYGQYAPHAVVTDVPMGLRQVLLGRYDEEGGVMDDDG